MIMSFTWEHWPHQNMLLFLHEDFLAGINGRTESSLKFQNFWIKDKRYISDFGGSLDMRVTAPINT